MVREEHKNPDFNSLELPPSSSIYHMFTQLEGCFWAPKIGSATHLGAVKSFFPHPLPRIMHAHRTMSVGLNFIQAWGGECGGGGGKGGGGRGMRRRARGIHTQDGPIFRKPISCKHGMHESFHSSDGTADESWLTSRLNSILTTFWTWFHDYLSI